MRTLAASIVTLSLAASLSACSSPRRAQPPAMLLPPLPQQPAPALSLPPEAPPLAQLPADTRPAHYTLSIEIDPQKTRFVGTVEIAVDLARPRDVVWLHGRDLTIRSSTVRPEGGAPIAARWEPAGDDGLAGLRLPRPVGPGRVTIRIDYDAAFGTQLHGLFKVTSGKRDYAFSQLEAIYAREAFPCFDEPSFKTPFDVMLFVPKGQEAISNGRAIEESEASPELTRVTFATTQPLPTYLVAFAVGPLDVVSGPDVPPNAFRKEPLSLRGVAAKGHGPELAYALERTGSILTALEGYFGVAYPYDKLDILAVPDMGGAMENAGAVTFRDVLLLLDPKNAPIDQKRAFASVMAHELAHQWFGNLVTMPWWDDIWLNEAFATWMAARTIAGWAPENGAEVAMLERVHGAMGADSLLSSRQIRQPVADRNDIENAFDSITYSKGGGVLGMFERFVGPETFQQGIHSYLEAHRFGSATSDDLLMSLSMAARRDIATPFRTFLFQPGVPFVEASLRCDGADKSLSLRQSRYFPLGSKGDPNQLWQIPICARFESGGEVRESCTLLTEREGKLPLASDTCPKWVLPNADAAGYYRWSLPPSDLEKLRNAGLSKLSVREKMSLANALTASFARGTSKGSDVLVALASLAGDAHPSVATAPMGLLGASREWLSEPALRSKVETFGQKLYAKQARDLGWAPKGKKEETPERKLLRQRVLGFLALTAHDPAVRREAAKLGRAYAGYGGDGAMHRDAIDPNLAGLALSVAVQDGEPAFFEALVAKLATEEDPLVRTQLLSAIGSTFDPALVKRALDLSLTSTLRVSEAQSTLWSLLDQVETRDDAWSWLVTNLDAMVARIAPRRAGGLPWAASGFCDEAHAVELDRVFASRVAALEGGPRNLAGALESIRLCAARRGAQEESLRAFFDKGR